MMNEKWESSPALDYDDILLVPRESTLRFIGPKDKPLWLTSRNQANPHVVWSFRERSTKGTIHTSHPFVPVFPANMTSIVTPEFARRCLLNDFPVVFPRVDQLIKMGCLNSTKQLIQTVLSWEKVVPIFFSVGINSESLAEFYQFYDKYVLGKLEGWAAGICVDVANGHSPKLIEVVAYLAERYPDVPIMAGNFISPQVYKNLAAVGCTIAKASIGSGSVCTTRLETGIGYPMVDLNQLLSNTDLSVPPSEFKDIQQHNYFNDGMFLLADGGLKHRGDIMKALATGANAVMSGYLFSGYKESLVDNNCVKLSPCKTKYSYYGMASQQSIDEFYSFRSGAVTPEGKTAWKKIHQGQTTDDACRQIKAALQSSLSMLQIPNIQNVGPNTVHYIRVNRTHNTVFTGEE